MRVGKPDHMTIIVVVNAAVVDVVGVKELFHTKQRNDHVFVALFGIGFDVDIGRVWDDFVW